MKAVLIRTDSVPVHSSAIPGSPRLSLSRQDLVGAVFSGERSPVSSPRISLNFKISGRRESRASGIRRAFSESDVIRSDNEFTPRFVKLNGAGSQSFPAKIPEEECLPGGIEESVESLSLSDNIGFHSSSYFGDWPISSISGDGIDIVRKSVESSKNSDRRKIGAQYEQMLKSNPGDSLLLGNYAKYLHQVEGDMVRAEEYYGRAILASPGDGELLSLYGKLVWETQRDDERARSYFDRAVSASPADCNVLGAYAEFMWEAEEDDEDDEFLPAPELVDAF